MTSGLVATLTVLVIVSLMAASARAGTYVVAECSPGINPGAPDATFTATTTHFAPFADCSPSAPGLEINYQLGPGETGTQSDGYGAWVIEAPAGTYITGGSSVSRLATQNGIHGYLAVSPDSGASVAYENQNDDQGHTSGIPPGNWRFWVARLQCTAPNEGGRCVGAGTPHTYVKQLRLQLTDVVPPTVAIGGSMLSGAVLHGPQTLEVQAADQGAGLQSVHVLVNGQEATGDDLSAACNPLPGGLTARPVPCPTSFARTYNLETAAAPFVQGQNAIQVCVDDYAQTGTPNTACESREVTVDNLCPGSPVAGGQAITAGFGNGAVERTIPFRSRSLIRGRLFDASGNPVVGALVCVEGHTNLPGRPLHLIGTATTNERGGWIYKLGHGPSRLIQVTYRAGSYQTATDLTLNMRARATLHLSVHRTCFHRRVYFSGVIAGPEAAGRVVLIRGTIPGAKRRFTIARAITDPLGHFRAAYAFAQVIRTTRFATWSLVPRQEGYPYVRGHSVARYIRVRPRVCPKKKRGGGHHGQGHPDHQHHHKK